MKVSKKEMYCNAAARRTYGLGRRTRSWIVFGAMQFAPFSGMRSFARVFSLKGWELRELKVMMIGDE